MQQEKPKPFQGRSVPSVGKFFSGMALVEFNGPATFDGYMELKFFLEEVLGCTTDLVTPKAIRPIMWPQIEKEAIQVA